MVGDELSRFLGSLCLFGAFFSYVGLVHSLGRYAGLFSSEEEE